jgi:hypothetical protein
LGSGYVSQRNRSAPKCHGSPTLAVASSFFCSFTLWSVYRSRSLLFASSKRASWPQPARTAASSYTISRQPSKHTHDYKFIIIGIHPVLRIGDPDFSIPDSCSIRPLIPDQVFLTINCYKALRNMIREVYPGSRGK